MIGDKDLERIINKQFEIIGEKMTFAKIPDDGMIKLKKKTLPWYHYYKFDNEDQYNSWREWAREELLKIDVLKINEELDKIDMLYGLIIKYKSQKGQLELL